MIKHANEENLTHWKKALQKQRELFTRGDTPRTRSALSTATTQFAWMSSDNGGGSVQQNDSDVEEESDDIELPGDSVSIGQLSANNRNGSHTNLRSRSTTESVAAAQPNSQSSFPRQPASRFPQQGHTPPLTLNTNPAVYNLANSPDRANGSYFSPVETPMMASRTSSSSQQYPFPRYPNNPNYYPDDPNRYTPPSMSRTPSREGASVGAPPTAQYAAYQGGQRLQRPSLPGMGPSHQGGNSASASAAAAQSRMRSASSPNIHHVPTSSQLSRVSPGGNIPPVPVVPGTYQPYNGGAAAAASNRSQTSSPTSPQLPIQGALSRTASPAVHEQTLTNGAAKTQVKVKIHFNNDKLAIIVPSNIAYAQLMDRIERKVKICAELSTAAPIRIKYQDEDGDFISMNSDDDVQMAFDVACEGSVQDSAGTCGAVTLYVTVGSN
jgi:cell division control protein 24